MQPLENGEVSKNASINPVYFFKKKQPASLLKRQTRCDSTIFFLKYPLVLAPP
jgi:hypothetical protein